MDPYRRVTLHRLQLKVNGVTPRDLLILRIYPLSPELSEVRFWREKQLLDMQRVKNEDLNLDHF